MVNRIKIILLSLLALCSFSLASAQNGTLTGKIIDDNNGEALIGVTVRVANTGTRSDIDGKFSISLPPATYQVSFSYMGFEKQEITEVVVKTDEVNELNIRMKQAGRKITKVVVRAARIKDNEAAILTIQKKAPTLLDGMSSQTFKKTGDNDAAAAIVRVTGVSIEDGKYVYVRGLGDRYSKSQLNGVDIPGLDPDRNTVQMDIFPTNLLDNIIVYKSFSPNLPGDFTGGMVNIETKAFTNSNTFNAKMSLGGTPGMTFNPNALTYDKPAADWLAMGAKSRKLPFSLVNNIPTKSESNSELTDITKIFNPQLAPTQASGLPNASFSLSKTHQINKENYKIGLIGALNYRTQFRHFDDFQFGRSQKDGDRSITELTQLTNTNGVRSEHEVSWSTLMGVAIKKEKSKYLLNFLRSQNAVSRAAEYDIKFPNGLNTAVPLKQYVLDYSQRSISNLLIGGKHSFSNNKWKLNWKLSPTVSTIKEPDIRSTTYLIENGYFIDNGDGAIPERYYRDLNEINAVSKIDMSRDFVLKNEKKTKLSFGAVNTFKTRDFQVLRLIFNNTMSTNWTGNGDELLESENIWSLSNPQGTYVRAEESLTKNPNIYEAFQNIGAAYIMNEYPISDRFRAIYGLRYERTDMWISGYGRFPGEGFDENKVNEKVMTENDFLPSLNLVYELKKDMNLRGSYSRTLARPSFKEKSFVSILDPLSNVRFIGNINLERTNIHNADLRWEYFMKNNQMISLSGFYKHFTNPIEIAGYLLEPNDITARNAGTAHLAGAEFETRKNLSFISTKLSNFSLGTNVSLIKSYIDMREIVVAAGADRTYGTSDDMTEYQSRSQNLRDGETLGYYRNMFGQAPFIINANLNYQSDSSGITASLNYNVQGKQLSVVGVGYRPDVFTQEFHSLNFKASKTFGKDDRWRASLTARNILNDRREQFFESYNAAPNIWQSFNPGTSFSLGLSFSVY